VPAHYHELPPVEGSVKYVAAMGGADKALAVGEEAFAKGEYRWAATVFNHVVFADTNNDAAKKWLASTYEQLGFQAEAGTWRSIYLSGAKELREGNDRGTDIGTSNAKVLNSIPAVDLFDALAARFNPAKMRGEGGIIQFNFPGRGEAVSVDLGKSVMFPRNGSNEEATAQVTISRSDFTQLLMRTANPLEKMQSGALKISGDAALMAAMFRALDPVDPQFNIVTP
jgi:alkyl sulfatase BDS1-like metallo-beta-lactamase superfamily hydrolase